MTIEGIYALRCIEQERNRQIDVEGWSAVDDDSYVAGQLANAAACYALTQKARNAENDPVPRYWPFAERWYKPTPEDRERELVKAGALIVAEIERLQREKQKP